MQIGGAPLLQIRHEVNGRGAFEQRPVHQLERCVLDQPALVLHAPGVEHTRRPHDIRNPGAARRPCGCEGREAEQSMRVQKVVVAHIAMQPGLHWEGDAVTTELAREVPHPLAFHFHEAVQWNVQATVVAVVVGGDRIDLDAPSAQRFSDVPHRDAWTAADTTDR